MRRHKTAYLQAQAARNIASDIPQVPSTPALSQASSGWYNNPPMQRCFDTSTALIGPITARRGNSVAGRRKPARLAAFVNDLLENTSSSWVESSDHQRVGRLATCVHIACRTRGSDFRVEPDHADDTAWARPSEWQDTCVKKAALTLLVLLVIAGTGWAHFVSGWFALQSACSLDGPDGQVHSSVEYSWSWSPLGFTCTYDDGTSETSRWPS